MIVETGYFQTVSCRNLLVRVETTNQAAYFIGLIIKQAFIQISLLTKNNFWKWEIFDTLLGAFTRLKHFYTTWKVFADSTKAVQQTKKCTLPPASRQGIFPHTSPKMAHFLEVWQTFLRGCHNDAHFWPKSSLDQGFILASISCKIQNKNQKSRALFWPAL